MSDLLIGVLQLCWLATRVFALYYTVWLQYLAWIHPLAKLPGPPLARFSNLWKAREVFGGHFDQTMRTLHKIYGPIVRIAPNEVSISSCAAISQIYDQKGTFKKGDFYEIFEPRIGQRPVSFTMRDELEHIRMRQALSGAYGAKNVLSHEESIDKVTAIFMERMDEFARRETVIDIGEWFHRYGGSLRIEPCSDPMVQIHRRGYRRIVL
jgi:cytochrome P450